MPRILVMANCDSELGDCPIVLDEECGSRVLTDQGTATNLMHKVGVAVADAYEVEVRVRALYEDGT